MRVAASKIRMFHSTISKLVRRSSLISKPYPYPYPSREMNTRSKTVSSLSLAGLVFAAVSAPATLLVYEPFDYPDGNLNGQGGALGTTGTWASLDTGFGEGWRVHPQGELSGVAVDPTPIFNVFDGTVDNLPTLGGYAGMAGPEDRGMPAGTDGGTGNLDASIGLDPSVTATFTSGTTTWFSFVSVHAWDRNQGGPQFMIGTDTTTPASRGLSMVNSGNGIGGGGGPPRQNLQDIYPQFFKDGVNNHTPGGYQNDSGVNGGGTLGDHDGVQLAFGSGNDATASGTLDNATQVMPWVRNNPDGTFGAANILVGKIEWDADAEGEDIISLVGFLETDTLNEDAFNDLIDLKPALSSRNWESNKPDLDQSQFDTLNFSSLKFFVDEIRIATTFSDVVGGGVPAAQPFAITAIAYSPADDMLTLTWGSRPGRTYAVKFSRDLTSWVSDLDDGVPAAEDATTTTKTFDLSSAGLAGAGRVYFRVERQ